MTYLKPYLLVQRFNSSWGKWQQEPKPTGCRFRQRELRGQGHPRRLHTMIYRQHIQNHGVPGWKVIMLELA